MGKMKTGQMATDAMLVALCALLGYISIDMGFIKITFESLPILLGALLFGPLDGMIIGGMGTLLYQILRYGITLTTVLWILPYVALGLVAGVYARRRQFRLNRKQIFFIVGAGGLMTLLLNTAVIYLDSKIYGYYTVLYVFGALALRIVAYVAESCAFGAVLPGIINAVHRSQHLFTDRKPRETEEKENNGSAIGSGG